MPANWRLGSLALLSGLLQKLGDDPGAALIALAGIAPILAADLALFEGFPQYPMSGLPDTRFRVTGGVGGFVEEGCDDPTGVLFVVGRGSRVLGPISIR